MKKRDLKSLSLNKKSISNLEQKELITGGVGRTFISICRSCRESRCRLCPSSWNRAC